MDMRSLQVLFYNSEQTSIANLDPYRNQPGFACSFFIPVSWSGASKSEEKISLSIVIKILVITVLHYLSAFFNFFRSITVIEILKQTPVINKILISSNCP